MQALGLNVSELAGGRRVHREINGRRITVLLDTNAVVRCFDSLCYHMGGELGAAGDVEDFNGRSCIKCPSHGHRIDLETGQRLDTDLDGRLVCGGAGVQRIHRAVVDADGSVRIVLHDGGFPKPSDRFNAVGPPRARAPRGLGAFGLGECAGERWSAAPAATTTTATTVDAFKPDPSVGLEPYGGVSKRAPPAPHQPASPAAGTVTALFRAAKPRTGVATPVTAPAPPARASAPAALASAPPSSPSRAAFAARGAAARAAVLAGGGHRPPPVAQRPLPAGQTSLTQLWGSGGGVEAMEI